MNRSLASPARRLARLKRALLALAIAAALVAGALYARSEQIVLGAEAYIFGYPLVMMDVTRANAALTLGPENHLRRVRRFPDADSRDVVRLNVDTLYTIAFIDRDKGPWVFEMAPPDKEASATLTQPVFVKMMTGTAGVKDMLLGDDLRVTGSRIDLIRFFGRIDKAPRTFPIVTP